MSNHGGGHGRGHARLGTNRNPTAPHPSVPSARPSSSSAISHELNQKLTVSTVAPLVCAPRSSKALNVPARPERGTLGRKCTVKANRFLVQVADRDLYHYDAESHKVVEVNPNEKTNPGVKTEVAEGSGTSYVDKNNNSRMVYVWGPILDQFKDSYGISMAIPMRMCQSDEEVDGLFPQDSECATFDLSCIAVGGLNFPIPDLMGEVCEFLGIVPCQLPINSVRVICGIEKLNEIFQDRITPEGPIRRMGLKELFGCYEICQPKEGSGAKSTDPCLKTKSGNKLIFGITSSHNTYTLDRIVVEAGWKPDILGMVIPNEPGRIPDKAARAKRIKELGEPDRVTLNYALNWWGDGPESDPTARESAVLCGFEYEVSTASNQECWPYRRFLSKMWPSPYDDEEKRKRKSASKPEVEPVDGQGTSTEDFLEQGEASVPKSESKSRNHSVPARKTQDAPSRHRKSSSKVDDTSAGASPPLREGIIQFPQPLRMVCPLDEDFVPEVTDAPAGIPFGTYIHMASDDEATSEATTDAATSPLAHTILVNIQDNTTLEAHIGGTFTATPERQIRAGSVGPSQGGDGDFVALPSASPGLARAKDALARSEVLAFPSGSVAAISVAEKFVRSQVEAKQRREKADKKRHEDRKRKADAGEGKKKKKSTVIAGVQREQGGYAAPPLVDLVASEVEVGSEVPAPGDVTRPNETSSRTQPDTLENASARSRIRIFSGPKLKVEEVMKKAQVEGVFGGSPYARHPDGATLSFESDVGRLPPTFTELSRQCLSHLEQGTALATRTMEYAVCQTREARRHKAKLDALKGRYVSELQAKVEKATTFAQAELDMTKAELDKALDNLKEACVVASSADASNIQLREYISEITGELTDKNARLERFDADVIRLQKDLVKAGERLTTQAAMMDECSNAYYAQGVAVGLSYARVTKDSKAYKSSLLTVEMPFPSAGGGDIVPRSPRQESDTSGDEEDDEKTEE